MQKLYFIYINSINNIYQIYAHELNDNGYFAIRIRRFSLRANEGFKTVCESFGCDSIFLIATQQNITNGFTRKAVVVWKETNSIVQDQPLQDKY